MNRICSILLLCLAPMFLAGCSVFGLFGAMAQTHQDQMLIEKLAEYDLSGKTVAVLIEADLAMHYEHPSIANLIAEAVAARIAKNVPDSRVINPAQIAQWQFETPQWSAIPSGDIVSALGVDCVVYIQIRSFRLTPPGNQWLWEGFCSALIGIIEADGIGQDGFDQSFDIEVSFPRRPSVLSHSEATEAEISRGLLAEFIKQTSWLFYTHEEPKHPDRYRPELET